MPKRTQQILAFGFGVTFVIVLLVLAIGFPNPTPFRYEVFKVVLSLAAAGVAAMIPGFLEIEVSRWIRAGGALGVFAVVYYKNPAGIIVPTPDPTAPFVIALACNTPRGVRLNTYSFPLADIRRRSDYTDFKNLVAQLPNQLCDQSTAMLFRIKDEIELLPSGRISATSNSNLGIIVMSEGVISTLGGNKHLAFTQIHSQLQAMKQ